MPITQFLRDGVSVVFQDPSGVGVSWCDMGVV